MLLADFISCLIPIWCLDVTFTPWVQEVVVHAVALHVCRLRRLVSPNGIDVNQMATPATHVGCVMVLNFSQIFVACLSQGLAGGSSRGVCGKEDFPSFHRYQGVSEIYVAYGLPVFYQVHWSLLPSNGCVGSEGTRCTLQSHSCGTPPPFLIGQVPG